jgi:hypothetical protein
MQLLINKSLIIVLIVFFFAVMAEELSQDEMRFIRYDLFSHQELEVSQDISDAMAALDYWDEELPFAYLIDLNQDGNNEIFLGSPDYRLCGTAGCPYFLVDGANGNLIGEFFGTLVLTGKFVNNYPVIQLISRLDMENTNLHTFVYEAGSYKMATSAILDSTGMDEWMKKIN